MGRPQTPDPSLLIIAGLYSERPAWEQAWQLLAQRLGPVRRAAPDSAFGWTDYYTPELGPDPRRCFLVAERLVPAGALADLKRLTNGIEVALSRADGRRRVNLDPGLINLENLVLASTKRQPQRLYLRDGIFAEVTLHFVAGRFEPLPRTYPEFRSQLVLDLLKGLRQEYKERLRAGAELMDPADLVTSSMEAWKP